MIAALLSGLWTKFAGYITAAGAILAVVGGIYFKGRSDAASRAAQAKAEQRLKSMTKARKVDDEIDRLGDDAVSGRLNEWMRDQ